jgi:hypothetical protein
VAALAVVSEVWRTVVARITSLDLADVHSPIASFKIGEGGSLGGLPITPDETFVDVQGEGEPVVGGGTVAFVNGNAIVTGTGTTFIPNVLPGDWIKPGPDFTGVTFGSAGVPGSEIDNWAEVQSVDSNIQITLTAPWPVTSISGRECRKASEPLFVFRKALTSGEVLFNSAVPAITEISCITLAGEANLDQLGGNPEFFEVGVFDANGVMLIYMTMDQQTKVPGVQLNNIIDIVF